MCVALAELRFLGNETRLTRPRLGIFWPQLWPMIFITITESSVFAVDMSNEFKLFSEWEVLAVVNTTETLLLE